MGKGDKKTKRGKIVIGSSGVRRARKKRNTTPAVASKVEPDKKTEAEDLELAAEKAAARKSSKKAEVTATAEDKSKAPKAKKKPAADELPHEEPKQE